MRINTKRYLQRKVFLYFLLSLVSFFLTVDLGSAAEIPQLTEIEIITEANQTKIILHLTAKANYYISKLDDPPRLLIDFKIDVESKLPDKQEVGKGNIGVIRSYYLAKSSGAEAVLLPLDALVIEFTEIQSYESEFAGNNIVVTAYLKTPVPSETESKEPEKPKELKEAIKLAETVEKERSRKEIEKLIEKGKSFYRGKNWIEAVEAWEEAFALDPENAQLKAYLRRAKAKITKKELEEEPLEEIKIEDLATIDDQIENYFGRGKRLYRQKNYREAVAAWDLVLKLEPDNRKAQRYKEKAKEKIQEEAQAEAKRRAEERRYRPEEETRVDMPKRLPDMLEEEFEDVGLKFENLSLEECMKIGLRNNNALKVSQEEVVLAYLKSEDARKLLLPKANLKWAETLGTTSGSEYRGRELSFELQQPLYDGKKSANTYRQAKVNIVVSEKNYEKAKNDFMFEIEEAYYVLANSQKILSNLKRALAECKKDMELMQKRVELELSKQVDLLSVKSSYNDTYLKVASALNDLELGKLSLKQKMGIRPNSEVSVQPTPPIEKMLDISFKDCLDLAYENRTDLLVNELMVLYHMYALKMAKGDTNYKVDLTASMGLNDEAYTTDPLKLENEWYVGLKVVRPLGVNLIENNAIAQDKVPSAGQTTSSRYTNNTFSLKLFQNNTRTPIADATVSYHKAIKDYEKAKNSIFYEIREGVFNYKKAILKINNNRSSIALTKKELAINKVKAELEEASLPDILKMKMRLHDQITDYEQAVTDYYTQIAKLNKLIGISRYFDPMAGRKNIKWAKQRFVPRPDIEPKRWWQVWKKQEEDEISNIIDEYYDLDEEFDKFYPMEDKRPQYRFWQFWKKEKKWDRDIYPVKEVETVPTEVGKPKTKFWQFWRKEKKPAKSRKPVKKIETKPKQQKADIKEDKKLKKASKKKWWQFWRRSSAGEKKAKSYTGSKLPEKRKELKPLPLKEDRSKKVKKEKEGFKSYYVEQIKTHRLLREEKQLLQEMEQRKIYKKKWWQFWKKGDSAKERYLDMSDFYPVETKARILIPKDKRAGKKWWKFWQDEDELNLYFPDAQQEAVLLPEEDDEHYRLKDEVLQLERIIEAKKGVQIFDFSIVEREDEILLIFSATHKIYFKQYELDHPTRLIISFESKVYSSLEDNITVDRREIKNIRLKRLKEEEAVTALVIDLAYPLAYNIYAEEKRLVIVFESDSSIL